MKKKKKRTGNNFNFFFVVKEFGTDPVLIWTPVIEGDYGQQRFLPEHPVQILNSGKFAKVPFISGVTSDEFADRAFSKYFL